MLQQRNSLLKQVREREASANDLNFWDQELAHSGGIILKARSDALGHIVPHAQLQMERLSDGAEHIDIVYTPAMGGADEFDCPIDETEWTARMIKVMGDRRDREIRAGSTLIGPHRDDWTIHVNGLEAGAFASRAQQRSAALSLRLAEASYLRNALGDDPVVLLDDVLSELDARRREAVLEYIDTFQQTIITTAEPDRVRDVMTRAAGRYVVSMGALTPFEGE